MTWISLAFNLFTELNNHSPVRTAQIPELPTAWRNTRMTVQVTVVTISVALAMSIAVASKHEAEAAAIEIEVYEAPELITLKRPIYPAGAKVNLIEGFVELHYMVGSDGKHYEISVQNSTKPRFEKNAIRAIEKFTYKPAHLNGKPLDAGETFQLVFAMQGGPARGIFRAPYQGILEGLRNQDAEKPVYISIV